MARCKINLVKISSRGFTWHAQVSFFNQSVTSRKIGFYACSWFKDQYDNPEIIITENGWSDDGELEDTGRIEYLRGHLQAVLDARLIDGCNVTGHTTWSILDNCEFKRMLK